MQPEDFRDVATALVKINHPAYVRSAISRIYYATFNKAKKCQADWGFNFFEDSPNGNDHRLIRQRLQYCYDNDLSLLDLKIRDLHRARKRADYQLNDLGIEVQNDAVAIVENALGIMSVLDTYAKKPIGSLEMQNIVTNIRNWESRNPHQVP